MGRGLSSYYGEIEYAMWRSGGNPNAMTYDRMAGYHCSGLSPEAAASREMEIQRRRRQEAEREEYESYLAQRAEEERQAARVAEEAYDEEMVEAEVADPKGGASRG